MAIRHNLVLAPLAGISDYPFREICRRFGADLTFTEMVSVDGLIYANQATRRLLKIRQKEQPVGIQLFGSDPELFRRTLPEIEELNPALIDINFGCPVRKVVGKGAGAALLKDLDRLAEIVASVCSGSLPVTAKIRIGWDWPNIVAVDAAKAVESGGADAITVHARTRSQGYSGEAKWEYIARVKQAVAIPVIGNGDVWDCQSAQKMFAVTAADGIMLARGVLGKPWLFKQILHLFETGEQLPEPGIEERLKILEEHYRLQIEEFPETVAISRMKKQFAWYTRGLPHTAKLRNEIFRATTMNQIRSVFSEYLVKISDYEAA